MGEAQRITCATNPEKETTRKRPKKPLRAVTPGTENLFAIKDLNSQERAKPYISGSIVVKTAPATAPGQPYAPKTGESSTDSSAIPAANDNIVAISSGSAALQFARRNKVAAGVFTALALGAVVGGAYLFSASQESEATIRNASTVQNTEPAQPLASVTPNAENILAPSSSAVASYNDATLAEPDMTTDQSARYLGEIEQLRALNTSLQGQIDELHIETTGLNAELLQLELALMEKQAEAQPLVETRTVYNFVNVSAGDDFASAPAADSYVQDDFDEELYYSEEGDWNDDKYYEEDEYYGEQYGEVPVAWDSNGQPTEFMSVDVDEYYGEPPYREAAYSDQPYAQDAYVEELFTQDAYVEELFSEDAFSDELYLEDELIQDAIREELYSQDP